MTPRRKRWAILLFFISFIFFGAIITDAIYHTGNPLFMGICGVIILLTTLIGIGSLIEGEPNILYIILSILLSLFLGFTSFVVSPPENGYAILENKKELLLVNKQTTKFLFLYSPPVQYLGDFKIKTTIHLPLEDGKEFVWDLVAKMKIVGDYHKIFGILVKFGGKGPLMVEIEKVIKEITMEYLLSNFKDSNPPKEFHFIPDSAQQTAKIIPLGYEVQEVRGNNLRLLKAPST